MKTKKVEDRFRTVIGHSESLLTENILETKEVEKSKKLLTL